MQPQGYAAGMRGIKSIAIVFLVIGLVALAAPAQALNTTITDPAGDAAGQGLDITRATLSNRDHAYKAAITFVADTPGNVIVAVGTRDGQIFLLISEHHSHGSDDTFVVDGSGQTVPCAGMSSTWDRPSAVLVLTMPSSCMLDGDYGAVHSWVLTEQSSGRDVDYAPVNRQGDIRFTPWIPRG